MYDDIRYTRDGIGGNEAIPRELTRQLMDVIENTIQTDEFEDMGYDHRTAFDFKRLASFVVENADTIDLFDNPSNKTYSCQLSLLGKRYTVSIERDKRHATKNNIGIRVADKVSGMDEEFDTSESFTYLWPGDFSRTNGFDFRNYWPYQCR